MDQMTICHVKGVASSDKPVASYHPTLLSSTRCFGVFQLIVLVFTTLNFWFTINRVVSSSSKQLFSATTTKKKGSDELTVRYMYVQHQSWQTDTVSDVVGVQSGAFSS